MQSTNINTCMPSEHQERLIERLSTACHVLPHNGFVSFVSLLIFFFFSSKGTDAFGPCDFKSDSNRGAQDISRESGIRVCAFKHGCIK